MTRFQIEAGVPIPKRPTRKNEYRHKELNSTMRQLAPGESFALDEEYSANNAKSATYQCWNMNKQDRERHFTCKKDEAGHFRIWRTK